MAKELIKLTNQEIVCCPIVTPAFYNSFDYTTTGNCLCHPVTLGLLTKASWRLSEATAVSIDERMHSDGGTKFQPDLVVRNRGGQILLIVDFESPNSSDERIPVKDVQAFLDWTGDSCSTEYLLISSLPNTQSANWELRYTSKDQYNQIHRGNLKQIRANPFRYWYTRYQEVLPQNWRRFPITFANFNGAVLSTVDFSRISL